MNLFVYLPSFPFFLPRADEYLPLPLVQKTVPTLRLGPTIPGGAVSRQASNAWPPSPGPPACASHPCPPPPGLFFFADSPAACHAGTPQHVRPVHHRFNLSRYRGFRGSRADSKFSLARPADCLLAAVCFVVRLCLIGCMFCIFVSFRLFFLLFVCDRLFHCSFCSVVCFLFCPR